MEITTIGIDLAKSVFAVCGADSSGRVVMRRQLRRPKVLNFMRGLPRCVVGMEASGGAQYWARQLTAPGHEVRLMSPALVMPYRKGNKTDRNDADAILEAVTRPSIRFVMVKSVAQHGEGLPRLTLLSDCYTIPERRTRTRTDLAATADSPISADTDGLNGGAGWIRTPVSPTAPLVSAQRAGPTHAYEVLLLIAMVRFGLAAGLSPLPALGYARVPASFCSGMEFGSRFPEPSGR
jgi:Transposase